MKHKLNIALIGCGRIGRRHAEHISRLAHLAAVCDVDPKKVEDFVSDFGTTGFDSIEELLKSNLNIDLISICTPNGLHAIHSISALNAGYHVLCEKPLAISVQDCGMMIRAAEDNNRRLFAIKQNRFNPPVSAVKAIIDRGDLGRIFSVQLTCFWNRNADYYRNSWKGTLDLDGGTLYTQFSHFIDLLYWMFGDIISVQAYTDNFAHKDIIEFEDSGVVILRFYNGTIGTINYSVNSYGKNMEGSLTVIGETGTVKIGGQYLNELEYQNIEGLDINNLPAGNDANNYGQYQGSMSNHDKVYENVIGVLLDGTSISTNSFEGLKTVEIIDKIYNSAKRNLL